MQQSEKFHFVHTSEVAELFQKIGLATEFIEGQLSCQFCGDIITESNFKGATKHNGELILVCDKPSCYDLFLSAPEEADE